MCGIVGVISNKPIPNLKNTVKHMNDLQVHRGPDGEGLWSSDQNHVHFGHRRLAIIDLSEAGAQPMHSHDDRYVITYNGEVYNYEALRKECEKKGSIFKSRTDTEVIIEYIRHFGVGGIKDFRGMWAFALYDKKENTVLLSRDPFGIKPLYYGIDNNVLYFSSEIKSLRLSSNVFSKEDEVTSQIFLKQGMVDGGEWTFFKNVKRFTSAGYAIIDLNKGIELDVRKYWAPPSEIRNISFDEAQEEFRRLLNASVTRHMRSDVPLAFCLSGGLDSSTLVSLAAKQAEAGQSLNSFTTHYPEFQDIDETGWARKVVNDNNINATWVQPTFDAFMHDFDSVLYHQDEPFQSTSIFAQNEIFKAIRGAGVKVSLDGQGADELMAGYHSFYPVFLSCLLKGKRYGSALKEASSIFFNFPGYAFRQLIANHQRFLAAFSKKQAVPETEADARIAAIKKPYENFQDYLAQTLIDTSIPCLLRYADRSSMRHSVESRVPFLDVDLVDFILSLPSEYIIRDGRTKYIMCQSMRGYVNDDILKRKDKMGFPSPEKYWLKRAFDLDVSKAGTESWRGFILERWRNMSSKSAKPAFEEQKRAQR